MFRKNCFRPCVEKLETRELLTASPATIALALTHSAEYYGDIVQGAYGRYLGRSASQTEVNGWVAAMEHGMSDEALEADFIGSTEYIQAHGGSGAGWVNGMYQDLLGRTPAQSEVKAWDKALAQGVSTTAVAYDFAASAERETKRVTTDYEVFLDRNPSAAEVAGWVNAFLQGASNENVVAGFIGSQENRSHFATDADWLANAYLDVLGRNPSNAEITAWVGPVDSTRGLTLTGPSLNSEVLAYAESQLGKTVGSGECTDLALAALNYAGAKTTFDYGVSGLNANCVWGNEIAMDYITPPENGIGGGGGVITQTPIQAGDIIQYSNVVIQNPDGSSENMPHHTAIIMKVLGQGRYEVLEQNCNNQRWVQENVVDLANMTQGTYWIYQPVAK